MPDNTDLTSENTARVWRLLQTLLPRGGRKKISFEEIEHLLREKEGIPFAFVYMELLEFTGFVRIGVEDAAENGKLGCFVEIEEKQRGSLFWEGGALDPSLAKREA